MYIEKIGGVWGKKDKKDRRQKKNRGGRRGNNKKWQEGKKAGSKILRFKKKV